MELGPSVTRIGHKLCKLMGCGLSSYHIASRGAVPIVAVTGTRIKATSDSNTYTLEVYFRNGGKEDATSITLTAGTINLITKETKQLASEKFTRLSAALWETSSARLNVARPIYSISL